MNLFLFGLSETQTDAKTTVRVPKLGYFDGRVTKLSSRVTLAKSRAGVVCHMAPKLWLPLPIISFLIDILLESVLGGDNTKKKKIGMRNIFYILSFDFIFFIVI